MIKKTIATTGVSLQDYHGRGGWKDGWHGEGNGGVDVYATTIPDGCIVIEGWLNGDGRWVSPPMPNTTLEEIDELLEKIAELERHGALNRSDLRRQRVENARWVLRNRRDALTRHP